MILTIYSNCVKYLLDSSNEKDGLVSFINSKEGQTLPWFSYKGFKIQSGEFKILELELSMKNSYSFDMLAKLLKFEKWKIPSNILSFKENKLVIDKVDRIYVDLYNLDHRHTLTYDTYLELSRDMDISKFNIVENNSVLTNRNIYFIPEEYLHIYPCFRGTFKSSKEMYQNYVKHGIKEGRIPNLYILSLFSSINKKKALEECLSFKETITSDRKGITFYVLTRTSNRPEKFLECCASVDRARSFYNIIHYIGYDNTIAEKYVKDYRNDKYLINLIDYKGKLHPNQYIDVFYSKLLETSADGWILVLDDDDLISTEYLFRGLSQYLTDIDKVIIWKLERPDKFIYPKNINAIEVGEIATCCYIYHTSKISLNHWGANGIGDYKWFLELLKMTDKKNIIYVPYALSKVNYENDISGWSAM